MKRVFITAIMLLGFSLILASCSKKSNPQPDNSGKLTSIATNWYITVWGGVDNNPLNFTIDATTATGTITSVPAAAFNFAVGDKLLTNITPNADGTFSAKGKFTYGTNNVNTAIRDCTLSLGNNNTQLTIFYPKTGSFPDLTYIFQKGTVEEL